MTTDLTITAPIVRTEGNRVFATSRDVAAYFGKNHFDVLRAVDDLLKTGMVGTSSFAETPYVHPQNGQTYRYFEMDRDGFTLLAMGFTGPKALKFKLAYIAAFNEAIERLKEFEAKAAAPALPDFSNPALAARAWADEWERRQAAEAEVQRLVGPATFGGLVAKTGRPLKEVAGLLSHLNTNQIGNDLINAGYLRRDRFTQVLKVVGKFRDTHFAPSMVIKNGEARQQITVCEKGYEVLAKLYAAGRLTMKKGHENAWRGAVPAEILRLLKSA